MPRIRSGEHAPSGTESLQGPHRQNYESRPALERKMCEMWDFFFFFFRVEL